MGERTGIAWTDHTFNTWWGCTKVSPACTHCYAATFDRRLGGDHWGPRAPRRFFDGDAHWNEPLKWNRAAERARTRRRVFCASMADVFEVHEDADVNDRMCTERARLWRLIVETPWLDWLLLTKRPENIATMVPWMRGLSKESVHLGAPPPRGWIPTAPWSNVWLGTTVENQAYADERIPHLLSVSAAVRFLSCEPLLGDIDLSGWLHRCESCVCSTCPPHHDAIDQASKSTRCHLTCDRQRRIDWVIAGCESGVGASTRETRVDWYRSLRNQCAESDTAFFLKQAEPASGVDTIGFAGIKRLYGRVVIDQPRLDGVQHRAFPR